jgi:hypothetical protein
MPGEIENLDAKGGEAGGLNEGKDALRMGMIRSKRSWRVVLPAKRLEGLKRGK